MITFLLYYRLLGATTWIPLLDEFGEQVSVGEGAFEWDTNALASGTYEVLIESSDPDILSTVVLVLVEQNLPPAVPTLKLRHFDEQGLVRMYASTFSDPNGADDFEAARWIMADERTMQVIYDSGWIEDSTNTHDVFFAFEPDGCYLGQVCYRDICGEETCTTKRIRISAWALCPQPVTAWDPCERDKPC